MKEAMQIFAAVGPLGGGKTTFVLNVIQALESRGFPTKEKVAYVVNDEGALIDGELARQRTRVVAMTNGCFTCSDTADLRATLDRLEKSGISWVFLEGFGIIAGNETRDFLESCPYPFHILCLLSQKHYASDLKRYAHVVKSQVRAATVAVGITKSQDWAELLRDDSIPQFVGRENPGIPLTLIPDSTALPDIVLDLFTAHTKWKIELLPSLTRHKDHGHIHHAGCGCGHHHRPEHSHGGHDVHGMRPYWFEVREGVTLDDIKRVFAGKDFLLRVKGAIEGHLFNAVYDDWQVTVEDRRRFVTFYASREVNVENDLPGLHALILQRKDDGDAEPGFEQLRYDVADRESTVAEIRTLLDEMPTDPVIVPSGRHIRILTHPEILQTLKDGIARRPSVKDEWFPVVLKRCMEYWVKCAEIIENSSEEILPEDLGKNRRELVKSIVWWVNRHGDFFGPKLVEKVERLHLGAMAAEGILAMTGLNSDTEPAKWECTELTEALSYGITHGDDPSKMIEAVQHCLLLAKTPEMKSAWSHSLLELEQKVGVRT